MEPLRLIYDGYEIEIRSGGNSMPIVTMRKMVTNTLEPDTIKLPTTIRDSDYVKTVPAWWEQPPVWWTEPSWKYVPSITTTEINNHQDDFPEIIKCKDCKHLTLTNKEKPDYWKCD